MKYRTSFDWGRVLAVIVLAVCPGCATGSFLHWKRDSVPAATARDPVVKIVCIWQAAEGQGLDGMPARGFAGQVLFFTHSQASPVRIDGDVRISLYDDHVGEGETSEPIHQFNFVGDAWTIHLADSVLGPAYNVFVPYTRKHPWQADCSLRVRLTPARNATVYSEMVHLTLPGPVAKRKNESSAIASTAGESTTLGEPTPTLSASVTRRTVKTHSGPRTLDDSPGSVHVASGGSRRPLTANPQSALPAAPSPPADDPTFQRNLEQIERLLAVQNRRQLNGQDDGHTNSRPVEPSPEPRRFRLELATPPAYH